MKPEFHRVIAGETPEPFLFVVVDDDWNPIDLAVDTAFVIDNVTFEYRLNNGPLVVRGGDDTNLAAGVVGWTPQGTDFAVAGFLDGSCYYHAGPDRREAGHIWVEIEDPLDTATSTPGGVDDIIDGGTL